LKLASVKFWSSLPGGPTYPEKNSNNALTKKKETFFYIAFMPAKRKYKDSVFTSLFGDKKRLLELYNAIEGTSYKNPNIININTLEGVLFANWPDPKGIYKQSLMKIPRPEFVVLYNGVDKYPNEKILKLSDAYKQLGKAPALELSVRVLNINKGRNLKLEQRSKSLAGYSTFVAKVRELQSSGNSLKDAIEKTVVYCIDKGILRDYLKQNSSEVVNMMTTEFKLKDAIAVAGKEGEARGEARGVKKLLALVVLNGKQPDFIMSY